MSAGPAARAGHPRRPAPAGRLRAFTAAAVVAFATALTTAPAPSRAEGAASGVQAYPVHPVRMIVPFPAGGSADIISRLVADKLSAAWGQPLIVDNRPGAAGNIGADAVAKAEPDGYTLLSTPAPPLVINPSLYPRLSFDPSQFVPVTVMAAVPSVLVVNPQAPAADLKQLISYARAHPGKLNYASQGNGTTSHLTTELMKSMADLKITHIPYKGSAPALADLIAGQVDMMFDNLASSLSFIRSGKLRALAVGSTKRDPALPDVPAMDEVLPGFVSIAWFAIVAPPKTSPDLAARIQSAVAAALAMPDVQLKLRELSAEPMGTTPASTAAFMHEEGQRWRRVIQSAGVKVD
jgi:tripartite-type tricarboxylate transporter receptor subunit TctC